MATRPCVISDSRQRRTSWTEVALASRLAGSKMFGKGSVIPGSVFASARHKSAGHPHAEGCYTLIGLPAALIDRFPSTTLQYTANKEPQLYIWASALAASSMAPVNSTRRGLTVQDGLRHHSGVRRGWVAGAHTHGTRLLLCGGACKGTSHREAASRHHHGSHCVLKTFLKSEFQFAGGCAKKCKVVDKATGVACREAPTHNFTLQGALQTRRMHCADMGFWNMMIEIVRSVRQEQAHLTPAPLPSAAWTCSL